MIITSICEHQSNKDKHPIYVNVMVGLVKNQCLPALCMELYLQDRVPSKQISIDSQKGILETVGLHISNHGSEYWPEKWNVLEYCDLHAIKGFLPKANELLDKHFPDMADDFT